MKERQRNEPDSADGEREAPSWCKVRAEYPVLRVVQRPVTYGCKDLSDDQNGIAIEAVCRRAGHDNRTAQVEARENDRHDSAAPLVDSEPKADT